MSIDPLWLTSEREEEWNFNSVKNWIIRKKIEYPIIIRLGSEIYILKFGGGTKNLSLSRRVIRDKVQKYTSSPPSWKVNLNFEKALGSAPAFLHFIPKNFSLSLSFRYSLILFFLKKITSIFTHYLRPIFIQPFWLLYFRFAIFWFTLFAHWMNIQNKTTLHIPE